MPTIPAMPIASGSNISLDTIYDFGLFNPELTPDTLEILNGGLDSANYGAGDGSITPRMCQFGSFAVGYYSGFNRTNKVYARQLSGDLSGNTKQRHIHTELSASIHLPWAPSALIFGYQGWFQQDATIWDANGTPIFEHWTVRLHRRDSSGTDGEVGGTRVSLPFGRITDDAPSAALADDPGIAAQLSWRYASKHKVITNATAGFHEFELQVFSGVKNPDRSIAKLKTVIGGFYVLAIR
tara:strand:- start:44 stop:760 length:717 start_codon:yes stop_codon:yes gene_type:complete